MAVDAALLDLFRAELDTHVPTLGEGLLALEKDPAQPKLLEGLMRAAHSIKGAARIVGLDVPVRVAHVMEDVFVAAQKGLLILAPDAIDVLLKGVDALQQVSTDPDGPAPLDAATLQALVERIAAVKTQPAPPPRPATPPVPPAPTIPVVRPSGVLDAAHAETLRLQLVDLLADNPPRVRLDLTAVEGVDPAGLLLLRRAAPRVELAGAAPAVAELLRLTRLDTAFRAAGG